MSTNESSLRRVIGQYGKTKFSQNDQVAIVLQLLENELINNSEVSRERELLANTIAAIEATQEANKRRYAKNRITRLIAELEQSSQGLHVIARLEAAGLKKMLFHNSQIKGVELPEDDILKQVLRNGFIGVGVSTLFIALFVATAFVAAPAWLSVIATGLFAGGVTYLSGILYGVVNDLFATKMNLPYFLLGHQPQQRSLLKTNDPYAQGIAWGVAATFVPVVIAAIVFAIVATITAAFVPLATFTLPLMMIAMPLIAVGAELYARRRVAEIPSELDVNDVLYHTNNYQCNGLESMCPTQTEKAAWFANSDRNLFGFTKVPLIGVVALVLLVGLSVASGLLPAVLVGSAVVTTIIPAGFALAAALSLGVAGCYMQFNKDRQIDNRYKLNWDNTSEISDDFTFDDADLPKANELLVQYQQRKIANEDYQRANVVKPQSDFRIFNSRRATDNADREHSSDVEFSP